MGLHQGHKKVGIGERIRNNIMFGMVIIIVGGCVYYFIAIVKGLFEIAVSLIHGI